MEDFSELNLIGQPAHPDRAQSGAPSADQALHRHRTPAAGGLNFLSLYFCILILGSEESGELQNLTIPESEA